MTFLPQQSRFHVRKRITWFLAGVAIFGGRIVNTPPEIKLFLKVKISLDIEVAKNQDFRREFMHKKNGRTSKKFGSEFLKVLSWFVLRRCSTNLLFFAKRFWFLHTEPLCGMYSYI